MGPYCNYCDLRCFVPNPRKAGWLLATCSRGREHDKAMLGYDIADARAQQAQDLVYYQVLPPDYAHNRFSFPFGPHTGTHWTAADGSRWAYGELNWFRQEVAAA